MPSTPHFEVTGKLLLMLTQEGGLVPVLMRNPGQPCAEPLLSVQSLRRGQQGDPQKTRGAPHLPPEPRLWGSRPGALHFLSPSSAIVFTV